MEIFNSFLLIFVAEMGDKTQILAMTFATKYDYKKVLLGVFLGSLLNHGIAVAVGSTLSSVIPLAMIRLAAGFVFLIFGFWSLRIEPNSNEEKVRDGLGPVTTVALAFFIGELGDKTQLTAIALASQGGRALLVLAGTVLGMVVTSGIGIIIGNKLGKKVPELYIKIASGGVFLVFGIGGILSETPYELRAIVGGLLVSFVGASYLLISKSLLRRYRSNLDTPLKKASQLLYLNTKRMKEELEWLTNLTYTNQNAKDFGEAIKGCDKDREYLLDRDYSELDFGRGHDLVKVEKAYFASLMACEHCLSEHVGLCMASQARRVMEKILFARTLNFDGNKKVYLEELRRLDSKLYGRFTEYSQSR